MTRHDLDLFSLLSGLVLSGIALAALFDVSADIGPWVWPTILIAVGVVVLASVLSSGRDGGDTADTADTAATAAVPADELPDHHRDTDDAVMADARAEVDRVDRGAPPSDATARDHTAHTTD